MSNVGYLVLEDGSIYKGECLGALGTAFGEVVFNTSMTGYQEMLTDPSYAGQIVIPTYPLIGNYGVNAETVESQKIQVEGFVVRECSDRPSHYESTGTLNDYLAYEGIPGLSGIDTRAVTRRLRAHGVMMGCVTSEFSPQEALTMLSTKPRYGDFDLVEKVSTQKMFQWEPPYMDDSKETNIHIVVSDCGLKYNILRNLRSRGCRLTILPVQTPVEEVLSLKPNGIVLSPGPGDPQLLDYAVETVQALVGNLPIMGICLGNQLLARAFGGQTYKLKFGHRGGNHPVRDLKTGSVHITAQNHGYTVDADSLPKELEVSHVNLNDGTMEGFVHKELPIMGIQFHSEASPGPLDNSYLFDRFLLQVKEVIQS